MVNSMIASTGSRFLYHLSCDIAESIYVKVGCVLPNHPLLEAEKEMFVSVRLYASGLPLVEGRCCTDLSSSRVWNDWLRLPILYRDAPLNCLAVFTLWGAGQRASCRNYDANL